MFLNPFFSTNQNAQIMIFRRLLVAAAIAAGCASPSAFAQASDILGVEIGMTSKQASDALQRANPKFILQTHYYQGPDGKPGPVAFIKACASNFEADRNCSISHVDISRDSMIVSFGEVTGRAYHLLRKWEPGPNDRPLVATFNEALQKKYGKLEKAREFDDSGAYGTHKNAQGKQDPQCRASMSYGTPKSAHPNCGLSTTLESSWDPKQKIMAKMTMQIFDHQVLITEIKEASAIASSKQQKLDASRVDAAKKAAAPKL